MRLAIRPSVERLYNTQSSSQSLTQDSSFRHSLSTPADSVHFTSRRRAFQAVGGVLGLIFVGVTTPIINHCETNADDVAECLTSHPIMPMVVLGEVAIVLLSIGNRSNKR